MKLIIWSLFNWLFGSRWNWVVNSIKCQTWLHIIVSYDGVSKLYNFVLTEVDWSLSPQLRDTRDDRGQAGPVSHVTIHHTTLHHHIKLYTPELAWPSHSHKTFSSVKSFTADCILQRPAAVPMSSLQSAVPHKSAWCNWLSSSPRHDFLSPVAGPVVWTVESIITFVYLRWCCCYVGTGTAWWW